jgi:chaperonin GroES
MNLKPLGARILVRPNLADKKTESGIIIPDAVVEKEKPTIGEIVDVGPGTTDEPMVVKVGDKVMFGKHAGSEVDLQEEKLLIMNLRDIYGVIIKTSTIVGL